MKMDSLLEASLKWTFEELQGFFCPSTVVSLLHLYKLSHRKVQQLYQHL